MQLVSTSPVFGTQAAYFRLVSNTDLGSVNFQASLLRNGIPLGGTAYVSFWAGDVYFVDSPAVAANYSIQVQITDAASPLTGLKAVSSAFDVIMLPGLAVQFPLDPAVLNYSSVDGPFWVRFDMSSLYH